MKKTFTTLCMLLITVIAGAQQINILPQMTPDGGTFEDRVSVSCAFPEGCAAGIYWTNGGQINANHYSGPITLDRTTDLSIAGINSEGTIITDVVTRKFEIKKVTPPYIVARPALNTARENNSFYGTHICWENALTSKLDLSAYKTGGVNEGKYYLWLTYDDAATPQTVAVGQNMCLSEGGGMGPNSYNIYFFYNYKQTRLGNYTIHIAPGVFIIDGKRYNEEIQLHYTIEAPKMIATFSPEPGEYEDEVTVTINYPDAPDFFYQFYKVNGGKTQTYTEPITITETTTFQAYGITEDFAAQTETATATYTIKKKEQASTIANPTIARSGNTITMKATDGATIKYWFDDHMQNAQLYNAPFTVSKNCKISAVAYKDGSVSKTINYYVTHFPTTPSETGNRVLMTQEAFETVHMGSISPNGRYVAGYTDSGGTASGFVWDLSSGNQRFLSTGMLNAVYSVSNDGVAFGWHEPETDDVDAREVWAYNAGNGWVDLPKTFSGVGITYNGYIYGVYQNHPSLYNTANGEISAITNDFGTVNCANADATIFAGSSLVGGVLRPTYWVNGVAHVITEYTGIASIVEISHDGNWMLIGNNARYNRTTGELEEIVSQGAIYNQVNEHYTSISNDGTLYGVYDSSLLSPESGAAMCYGTDKTLRSMASVLKEQGIDYGPYMLRSVTDVKGDGSVLILTAFSLLVDTDNGFTQGMAILRDVNTAHSAPVAVSARQISGMELVKVEWQKPINEQRNTVTKYIVMRNGTTIATVDAGTLHYYDSDILSNTTYTYTIKAQYTDGVESEESFSASVTPVMSQYLPVRQLEERLSGLNDVNLKWALPVTTLPKLQYFDEESDFYAFGTGTYSSEWGIRIPASDLEIFEGQQIRTFQFLPTGQQGAYTINIYTGDPNSTIYDLTPIYSQTVDPQSLHYGVMNTIELTTPIDIPAGKDIYPAIFIKSVGNDNMLGVSYEHFKSGYTDLCKVDGVHPMMVAMSKNSTQTIEVVLPIGIGICSEAVMQRNTVKNYDVAEENVVLTTTEETKCRIENVSEGIHTYSVTARYADGKLSEPATIRVEVKNNPDAYVAIDDVNIVVNDDNTATLSWEAPLNNDVMKLHYGNLTPGGGLPMTAAYNYYLAASVYPVTMTADYAGEYEISGLFYYPTADALFTLQLDNTDGEIFDVIECEPTLNKLNIVELEEPLTIDPSTNYRLLIDVYDCPNGKAPLAMDTSNHWVNGYSNLLNTQSTSDEDFVTLSEVAQASERPNWLMGLVIRQKNAKPMPLDGYNISIDGTKLNSDVLTSTTFTTIQPLAKGTHNAQVDVVYNSAKTVNGTKKAFEVTNEIDGISTIDTDNTEKNIYDLQGRRVINDRLGRGIFIYGGKKVVK